MKSFKWISKYCFNAKYILQYGSKSRTIDFKMCKMAFQKMQNGAHVWATIAMFYISEVVK